MTSVEPSEGQRPTSFLDLAPELVELIVSAIEDTQTLARLMQTSKQLLDFIYKGHLYYREVRTTDRLLAEGLWEHLAAHPVQTANVHTLRISEQAPPHRLPFLHDESSLSGEQSPPLEAIKRMPNLQTLFWETEGELPEGVLEKAYESCWKLADVRIRMFYAVMTDDLVKKCLPAVVLLNLVVFELQIIDEEGEPEPDRSLPLTRGLLAMLGERCPNLTHIHLEIWDASAIDGLFENTWTHLRELNVPVEYGDSVGRTKIGTFLARHPGLEHVKLEGDEHDLTHIQLPSLRTLAMEDVRFTFEPDEQRRSLEYVAEIELGHAQAEHLLYPSPGIRSIVGIFAPSFLNYSRNFSQVERLDLHGTSSTVSRNLAAYIAFFPGLEILILKNRYWETTAANDFLRGLPSLCPELEYADVTFHGPSTITSTREADGTFSWGERLQGDKIPPQWDPAFWPKLHGALF